VIMCGDVLAAFPMLEQCDKPLVVDGYDPHTLETLALFDGMAEQHSKHCEREKILEMQCAVGDFFICASERQRDWWLGLLEAAGRVNSYTYSDDPSLRRLVDVVPFGLSATPPHHTKPVIKGIWPGITSRDKVVLWGGGLWRWLDPFTAIRAMGQIANLRDDVRLVFPGTRHPHPGMSGIPTWSEQARDLSRSLGVLDTTVFFGDWIPLEDWPNVLLESDVGISLHLDTIETRLAFRTRVVDYVWAGLPMILTKGDATGDLASSYGFGTLVDYEKTDDVAQALLSLLEVPKNHFSEQFKEARDCLSWETVAQPLLDFCTQPRRAADTQVRARGDAACRNSLGSSMDGGRQGRLALQETVEVQKVEINRLRKMIAGYEGGRFIRVMKWLRETWASLRSVG
jgi:glycosyltransferase involved in cell wall biosynthesis